jgi:hypothetical protein
MHIPPYAHAEIQNAVPLEPTAAQRAGATCCLCDTSFAESGQERTAVLSGDGVRLHACRACLTPLVARARRRLHGRHATTTCDRPGHTTSPTARERYLTGLDDVRRAAGAVAELVDDGELEPAQVAWLAVSLESAYAWATEDQPESSRSGNPVNASVARAEMELWVEMATARERIAHRLVYHVIDESAPPEPELCEEFECPPECSGRHETDWIDRGPDAIFEDLRSHGIAVRVQDQMAAASQE